MSLRRGFTLAALVAAFTAVESRASVVVDAFTVAQTLTQQGVGLNTSTASGPGILGGTRTLSVFLDATPPFAVGVANIGNGIFSGSFTGPNNPTGGSYFDLAYSTAATNVANGNQGISFAASSQGGSTITIAANGSSTATITVPDAPGFANYFISFASFSNPSVFSALTSLDFKATFPNVTGSGPSISINTPIIISSIPEPSVLALGSLACVMLAGLRLRRNSQR